MDYEFVRNLWHRLTGELVDSSRIEAEHNAFMAREEFVKHTGVWEPVNEFRA